jgi:iron complex transport system ATP-binding protein
MTLRADAVVVRAGAAELLRGVSLELRAGEVLAVVGPNGAGKSTLLRTMAGDLTPSAGEVQLDGRPLRSWSLRERALRRAVMIQDTTLAFPWRAAEVVMLGRIPHHGGNPGPEDHELVARLLAEVDASWLADRAYATLSGGERQRVQLARALAQLWSPVGDPGPQPTPTDTAAGLAGSLAGRSPARYLLLDEPTASLDLRHQHLALRLLRRTAADGVGILVVLHDLNLAAEHADRIALVRDGMVVEVGTPSEVLRTDLLEAVFAVPMLVVPHPRLAHPLVVPDPSRTS